MTIQLSFERIRTLIGYEPDDELLQHLAAAALEVVTTRLGTTGQSDALLAMITEHLTAHYFEIGSGTAKTSERFPDYAVTYSVSDLAKLGATRNGRIAAELDQSGLLTEQSKPKSTFAVLGPTGS